MVYSSLAMLLVSEALTMVEATVVVMSGVMATAYAAALWHVVRAGSRPIRWLPLPR